MTYCGRTMSPSESLPITYGGIFLEALYLVWISQVVLFVVPV